MFKIEVGKGPLMFMPYSRIIKTVLGEIKVEEIKGSYYAILYKSGMPIGCGRMKIEDTIYTIDNIKIFKEFYTQELIEDISNQLLKKAKSIGLEEKN